MSEVIDNKQLRRKEYFDVVMTKLLNYHKIKKIYLVNLVKEKLSDSDKQLLNTTKSAKKYYDKIQDRINNLLKKSDSITTDENNYYTTIDKSYNRELRDLTNTLNNFRRYLFLDEFEKDSKRQHDYTTKQKHKVEVEYEFDSDNMKLFDKSCKRYFDLSHDRENNRKNKYKFYTIKNRIAENIIDLDKLKEQEDFYTTITLTKIHDKYLNKYKKLIKKKRKQLFTTKRVKQVKVPNISELIQVIKSLSSS